MYAEDKGIILQRTSQSLDLNSLDCKPVVFIKKDNPHAQSKENKGDESVLHEGASKTILEVSPILQGITGKGSVLLFSPEKDSPKIICKSCII